jgi:hypothetical protein
MSEIRQPVLSLKLDVATATQATGGGAGGGGSKEIVVEMTKEETDRVLRSMDAAYQHMEKLKS